MAKLIAKKRIPYKGRMLNPGDEFEVTNLQTKRMLVGLGKATVIIVDDIAPVTVVTGLREEPQILVESEPEIIEFDTSPEEPEGTTEEPEETTEESEEILPKTGKKKRSYKRRDMTAEEDD
jgi:hypothetical protein